MVKTLLETGPLLPRFEITVCECPPRMVRGKCIGSILRNVSRAS